MKVGLVGFAGAGKTTVLNALTGLRAAVGIHRAAAERGDKGVKPNKPNKPNLGVIKVPDERIDALARIFRPRRVTYAEIAFVDFPGGEREARATVLDPALVVAMRDVDALALVVRGFPDAAGRPATPVADLHAFLAELILADLGIVEKRLERLRKEKGHERERALLETCTSALEAERPLRDLGLRAEERAALAGFAFVSLKPLLVLLDVAEGEMGRPLPAEMQAVVDGAGVPALALCGQVEMEVAELAAEERAPFLRELGVTETARSRFIQASYRLLSLISFLTVGEDEVRAWPIREGTTAVVAAGKIHSDIARGFIRAEVVRFEELVQLGSEARCREAGKLRLEGRDYVVRDGDVIHFRFAV
jgi:GTP-binding protein YchF